MMSTPLPQTLVTGAAGFIGSHLVERLVTLGHHVRALVRYGSRTGYGNLDLLPDAVRREIELVEGDLLDPAFVDAAVRGCHTVLHLGAVVSIPHSYASPQMHFEINALGTLNIAEACRRHEVRRLVHTSTSEVYGSARTMPMAESHPRCAQSPYAASKIAADAVVESFHRSFGLPAVIVRPFNTYGPRQSTRAVIPAIISQLVLGCDALALGSLEPTRDLVHVRDTVEGFVAAASADASVVGGQFNLATGREISIGELAREAMAVVGRDVPIHASAARLRPTTSEVSRLCGDASAARAGLGWSAKIPLRDGLAEVADFVRRYPERFRPAEQLS